MAPEMIRISNNQIGMNITHIDQSMLPCNFNEINMERGRKQMKHKNLLKKNQITDKYISDIMNQTKVLYLKMEQINMIQSFLKITKTNNPTI